MQLCPSQDSGVTNQRRSSNYMPKCFLLQKYQIRLSTILRLSKSKPYFLLTGKTYSSPLPTAYERIALRKHRVYTSSTATMPHYAIAPDSSSWGGVGCAERARRRQHVPPDLTRMNAQRCSLALVCFSVFLSGLCQGTQNRIMRK